MTSPFATDREGQNARNRKRQCEMSQPLSVFIFRFRKRKEESPAMSIPSLTNTQTYTESRRTAAKQAGPSGSSFQDLLSAAVGAAQTEAAPDLRSALLDLRNTMLDRMKLNKEKKDEKEAWERLMKYIDAWIESLREGTADIGKITRAYAALKAAEEDERTGRMDAGDRVLEMFEQLTV